MELKTKGKQKIYHVSALRAEGGLVIAVIAARSMIEIAAILIKGGYAGFEICPQEELENVRAVIFKKEGKVQIHFFEGGNSEEMDKEFCDANREQASFLGTSKQNKREVLGVLFPNRMTYGELV